MTSHFTANSSFILELFYFMCVSVLPACMDILYMCKYYLQILKYGVGSRVIGAMGGCEPLCGCWVWKSESSVKETCTLSW